MTHGYILKHFLESVISSSQALFVLVGKTLSLCLKKLMCALRGFPV